MMHIPQLQLTDDEMERLQAAAGAANLGVYDYILLTLVGRRPAGVRPPPEPAAEVKPDAAPVEQKPDGGDGPKARRGRG